ncbi:hypothetical protein MPSEU_000846000 [Mayamaea pseudoterrestris]|nr:hypothetical protein MPSEU_000846000 [Mayamaea pseudoterrestris]
MMMSLLRTMAMALLALAALQCGSSFSYANDESNAAVSVTNPFRRFLSFSSSSVTHRRLQTKCPKDSIYHCNDPSLVDANDDDSVKCDLDTCRWVLGALEEKARPKLCQGIQIEPDQTDSISDTLEPCLWWEMLYGEFQPTAVPSTPSLAPTIPLTQAMTLVPTILPTLEPTLPSDSTSNPTFANATESQETNSTEPPLLPPPPSLTNQTDDENDPAVDDDSGDIDKVEIESFLLTLLTLDETSSGNGRNLRRRRQLQQQESISFDRSELLQLTEEHLLTELNVMLLIMNKQNAAKSLNNTTARIQAITGSVTGVRSEYEQPVWTITEAIHGHVVFDAAVDADLRQAIPSMVARAMHGAALQRFMERLQAANDLVLQATFQVYVGFSSAVREELDDDKFVAGSDKASTSSNTDDSMILPFEWNIFWICIIVIGGTGFLGCCLAACLLCRNQARRRGQDKEFHEENNMIPPSRTSQTDESSGGAAEKGSAPTTPSGFMVPPAAPRGSPSKAVKELAKVVDSDDDDDESQAGRYPVSEGTSCYSYIESNSMIGDQSYSIAPSLMYNTNVLGDDDDDESQTVESRMWSVADGIAPDASMLAANDVSFLAPPKPMDPRNQMVIFSDDKDDEDDDDLSLVSERAPREQVNIVGLDQHQLEAGTQHKLAKEMKQWSIHHAYSQDSDDQSSIVDQTRLKFASGLPLVQEISGASEADSSAESSSHDMSMETPRARGGNLQHDLMNESTVSSIAMAPDYPAESSDDESSLFMGPGITSNYAMTLSANNKVTAAIPNGIVRASSTLTDKEKQTLGILPGRETVEADEDTEDEDGNPNDDSFLHFFPTPYTPRNDKAIGAATSNDASDDLMTQASF